MKQIKNKYFWAILLLSTWPLTLLAFAICGYFKLNFTLVVFLGVLGVLQGIAQQVILWLWSYADGTIKGFVYEEEE